MPMHYGEDAPGLHGVNTQGAVHRHADSLAAAIYPEDLSGRCLLATGEGASGCPTGE